MFGIIVQAITNKEKVVEKESQDMAMPLLQTSKVETKKPAKTVDVEEAAPKERGGRKKTLREMKQ